MREVRGLIAEQVPHLRRYARALVRDPVLADDLVQDCLERAWSRLHLWRQGTDLRAWLFTILHNLHVNSVRRQSRQPDVVALDAAQRVSQRATQHDGLDLEALDHALSELQDDQRAAVLLVGLEGMTYREAAEVMDIPIGTLMSRLHRGRERLRRLLESLPVRSMEHRR